MTARKSRSTRERTRIFTLHGGRCHLCCERIDGSREAWDLDHVLALGLGGDESDENVQPAHARCHRGAASKTSDDVDMMRKADRQRARHLGLTPKSPAWNRGWKRKMDGTVERRS